MNFRQVFLVLKREFMTRAKSKAFIISTLLIPFGFVAYLALIIGIQFWESQPERQIALVDQSGVLAERIIQLNEERYIDLSAEEIESVREDVMNHNLDGYIVLGEEHILGETRPELIYSGSISITLISGIRSDLREAIREERLARAEVTREVREIFESTVSLESRKLTVTGEEEEDHAEFYSIVGMLLGVVIFTALFMYGSIIMRGVIEEKSNRIIEVIASSIKPIELLTGKILGITALAVTQFVIWTGLIVAISMAAAPIAALIAGDAATAGAAEMEGIDMAGFEIPAIPLSILVAFFFFFVLGYFLYSALFAAIGSAVDSESDTQMLMMPVFIPIFIGFMLNFEVIQNPDSVLSVIGSLIPFTSPINMVSRIAIGTVPAWQLIVSVLLLLLTILGTMMLSARIYRVGILQYGSKAGFKDLARWFRQK